MKNNLMLLNKSILMRLRHFPQAHLRERPAKHTKLSQAGNQDNIGILDVSNMSFRKVDIAEQVTGDGKYSEGVLAGDKVVFVRSNQDNIGILEVSNMSFRTLDTAEQVTTSEKKNHHQQNNDSIHTMPNFALHLL